MPNDTIRPCQISAHPTSTGCLPLPSKTGGTVVPDGTSQPCHFSGFFSCSLAQVRSKIGSVQSKIGSVRSGPRSTPLSEFGPGRSGPVRSGPGSVYSLASDNAAEYEALLAGMNLCYALGAEHLCTFSDSQLIVSQVMGEYEARDAAMVVYLAKVKARSLSFKTLEIKHVPRSENRQADTLSKLASSSPDGHPKSIRWEILHQPTITPRIVP